ncbi:MAG TPA: hypothetical protein DCY88_24930 [Cyanobacteria bacterium UBA11372]|nr:hypothetical protein [Cyanobacteria bacterium UBA11372]
MKPNCPLPFRRNRYNSRGLWWSQSEYRETPVKVFDDSEYFASPFELDVYRRLTEFSSIVVYRQHPLLVKDATNVYSRITWRCDFRVEHVIYPNKFLNIEVKGFVKPEFKHTLKYLEYFSYLEYSRLILITKRPQKIDKYIHSYTINDIAYLLENAGLR